MNRINRPAMKAIITYRLPVVLITLLVFVISGCGIKDTNTVNVHELEIRLSIEPEVIRQGEAFRTTYSVRNVSSKEISIQTYCVYFAMTKVLKDDEFEHIEGGNIGCRTSLGFFDLLPGEALVMERELFANSYTLNPDTENYEWRTTAPGSYVYEVVSTIAGVNGKTANIPDMRQTFEVAE